MRIFLPLAFLFTTVAIADSDDDMGRRVQELLRAHQADVFGCVAAQTKDVQGEVLVRVFIGDDQRAARAEILKDQTNHPPLGKCLTAAVRSWDLSPLKADAGDQVVFPLAFRGGMKVFVDKQAACGPNETGFYVLKGGRFNGKPVNAGDVIWTPANAACRFDKAEVLRVRWLGTPAGGETTIITPPAPYDIKGGNVRIFLEGKSVAIDLLTIDAGVTVPLHKHDASDEVIYMISGKCDATYGGDKRKLAAGDTLHMLAGTEHTVTVGEKLTAVQVYAPAGPEQRFKAK